MDLGPRYSVVHLMCANNIGPLWLLLPKDANERAHTSIRAFNCCCAHRRLVVPSTLCIPAEGAVWEWRDIYLSPRPKYRADPLGPHALVALMSAGISPPFRIKASVIRDLEHRHRWELVSATRAPVGWTGDPPVTLTFSSEGLVEAGMTVTLGRCAAGSMTSLPSAAGTWRHGAARPDPGPHYVSVRFYSTSAEVGVAPDSSTHQPMPHECPHDHVALWPGRTRVFEGKVGPYFAVGLQFDYVVKIRVSCTPSLLSATGGTLDLCMDDFEVRNLTPYP